MKYYKLLKGVNVNKIVMIDPTLDYEHFEYCFNKDEWVETDIFASYLWPYDEEFEQYKEIDEIEASKLLNAQKQQLTYLLELAERTAIDAHKGQVDIGGHSYINHPKHVANCVDGLEQKIIAWLHDVLEDTEITEVDLRKLGFTESIIHSIKLLTKDKHIDYEEYLWYIKRDKNAKIVKLADLAHNMDTSRLGRKLEEKDKERLEKYKKAVEFLRR